MATTTYKVGITTLNYSTIGIWENDDFDAMDNYLSDTYGYCVESYDVEC